MKKLGFILMLSCIALLTSCKDDKDDDVKPGAKDYAKEIAGRYAGKDGLAVTLPAQDAIVSNGAINLTTSAVNKINLELKDFSFAGAIKVGDIVLKDIVVEGNDNEVIIKKTEIKGYKLSNDLEGQTVDITVESGKVVGNKITIKLLIDVEGIGRVVVVFDGDKNDKSGEAKITKATTEDKRIVNCKIDDENSEIVLVPNYGVKVEELTEVVLNFEVSPKATAAPISGSKFDLTKEDLAVKIVAEDGIISKTYNLKVANTEFALFHDMETWVGEKNMAGTVTFSAPIGGWTSSNHGVYFIKEAFQYTDRYSITKVEDAFQGKYAAKIETLDTQGNGMIPKVTAGSLYTGLFDIAPAMSGETLKATKFGVPFNKNPKTFKGYYKYKSGPIYYQSSVDSPDEAEEVKGKKDECSINAVLYEITSDQDPYLTGVDVNTSNKRVAIANFSSGDQDAYKEFNVPFTFINGKTYDKSKKYRIAIIASSSRYGDTFSGAPGSTLYVDDLEIVAE